jgi:hypothetical protein
LLARITAFISLSTFFRCWSGAMAFPLSLRFRSRIVWGVP